MARVPSYAKTTALVSRALSCTPEGLVAAFVPATQADLAQVVELRKQVLGEQITWDDVRYLSWRYHFGSAERGRGECWVVKRHNDVLAMVGSERLSVMHKGHSVDALSLMDIAVRPELDGVGLGVWVAMHLCERTQCVLAIGSNSHSRAIVSRVFVRLPDRRAYAHLLRFAPTLQRRWRSHSLAMVGAALAQAGMSLWRTAVSLTRVQSIRIEPLHRFDASVDRLILQSRAEDTVSLSRDHVFLNWRLFDSPRSAYRVWGAYDADGLAGYLAARVQRQVDGTTALALEDFLVRAGNVGERALKTILCHVLAHALDEGCERVTVIAYHHGNERVLRRLGFFSLRADAETLSVRCQDPRLNESMSAGVSWHMTGANTDRDE